MDKHRGGNVNHNTDLSIEIIRPLHNASRSSQKYIVELYDRLNAILELNTRRLIAEVLETMLYDCATWSPGACHYHTLYHTHYSVPTRCIGWRKNDRIDHLFHI